MRSVYDLLSVSPSLQQTYPRELLNPTMAKGQEAPCLCTDTKSNQEGGFILFTPIWLLIIQDRLILVQRRPLVFSLHIACLLKELNRFHPFFTFFKNKFHTFWKHKQNICRSDMSGAKGIVCLEGSAKEMLTTASRMSKFPQSSSQGGLLTLKGDYRQRLPMGNVQLATITPQLQTHKQRNKKI